MTIPDEEPTVATVTSPDDHTPPDGVQVRVMVPPGVTLVGPVTIPGAAPTVTTAVVDPQLEVV